MQLKIVNSYEEMSKLAAQIVTAQIILKENSVLGLATGSTPEGMYKKIVENYQEGIIDFKNIKTFNLDEYYGLDRENDQSYYYFMNKHLYSHVNLKPENIHIPSGKVKEEDIEDFCEKYDSMIENSGSIDLQILGIGVNAHIGFNEPGKIVGPTHLVNLTENTIEVNSRFFKNKDSVPKKAITMGMKSILNSKKILLIASGKNKAKAIYNTVEGPITQDAPASLLRLHKDVVVIVDKEAASLL